MVDPIFSNPRLVAIYDDLDGHREDLKQYLKIVRELDANSVLDVGCGTGCLAHLLSQNGCDVTGVDPAQASLEFAQNKPHAEHIRWILGDTSYLPAMQVDLAIMTGNVAQVFLTDKSWEANLISIKKSLQSKGHLVFEVRDPSKKAWLDWTKEKSFKSSIVPKIGLVTHWCEVTKVANDLVSFRWTYVFGSDGETIFSDSTLRFRERDSIQQSLIKLGYSIQDIRDAPDRPGKEFVFIATLQ